MQKEACELLDEMRTLAFKIWAVLEGDCRMFPYWALSRMYELCLSFTHESSVVSIAFTNLAIAVQHEKTCTFLTQVVQKQVLQCRRRCCKEWLPSLATTEFLFLAICTFFTPALITPASPSSLPCRPHSTVPSASPLPFFSEQWRCSHCHHPQGATYSTGRN